MNHQQVPHLPAKETSDLVQKGVSRHGATASTTVHPHHGLDSVGLYKAFVPQGYSFHGVLAGLFPLGNLWDKHWWDDPTIAVDLKVAVKASSYSNTSQIPLSLGQNFCQSRWLTYSGDPDPCYYKSLLTMLSSEHLFFTAKLGGEY